MSFQSLWVENMMKSLDERPSRAMGPAHNQTARALTKECLKNGDQDITGPLAPARAGTQNNPHK